MMGFEPMMSFQKTDLESASIDLSLTQPNYLSIDSKSQAQD